jgi:hypothetical protein
MNVEDLKALARGVEPLSVAADDQHDAAQVAAYNDLVFRFRKRIATALNGLKLGRPHEPELAQELFLIAQELPRIRRGATAAAPREPTVVSL